MKYILAIDQGTTNTRAIIFDKNTNIIATANSEITQHYPHPGWVLHDPNEIWESVLKVIKKVLFTANIKPDLIHAIGITNQRETTIVWDKLTGKPIYDAIVWQSRQTKDICDFLKEKGYEKLFKEKTGLVIDPYFSATKIKWILDNVKGAKLKAKNNELLFGTIDTWLVYKLTGKKVHITDYTNASRTLLFNIHTLTWDQKLCDILDIPVKMLPEVKSNSEIYGYTNKDYFDGYAVPISGMAGDQQAALFGQTCLKKGEVKNTYGTGCFMLMNTGNKIVNSENGLLSTIAWKINEEVTYALEGSVFIAGSAVKWLKEGINLLKSIEESEVFANKLKNNEGVYFVPSFVGLGTPYWDQDVKGAIFGLTNKTTKEHIIRATLEAIAYQSADVLKAMEEDLKEPITALKVDGGATANEFLMQFQADILNISVNKPEILETTALGAAYLAGLSTGYWKNKEEIKKSYKLTKTYLPNLEEKLRSKYLNGWKIAIDATRKFKFK